MLELMHPALLRASGWRYTGRLRELFAARWAGCLASFDELPKHRRVDVVAAYEVAWRIDAVNSWESVQKAPKKRGKR